MIDFIRVFVVDDHPLICEGLRMRIDGQPDLRMIGAAANAEETLRLAADLEPPDIVLLDIALEAGESGLGLIPRLRQIWPAAKILVMTGSDEARWHRQAMSLGARGVFCKTFDTAMLPTAIRRVHAGELWLDARTATAVSQCSEEEALIESLTPRERTIIALVAQGLATAAIADRLAISEKTVRHHLGAIYGKLQLAGRVELTLLAVRYGLEKEALP